MTSSATAQTTGPAGRTPLQNGANGTGAHAAPRMNSAAAPGRAAGLHLGPADLGTLSGARLSIAVDDWDMMFDAVRSRLMHSVDERLGQLPDAPQHSAELSASLVQAVVLDCVSALDQLHTSLRQQRSQGPAS